VRLRMSQCVMVLVAGLGVLISGVVVVTVSAAKPNTVGWTLSWGDDFTGPAGSAPNGWKFDVGKGVFGDGDIAALTDSPANVRLDGQGGLDITALGNGQSWTSARIQTDSSSFAAPVGGELMVTASIEQPDPADGLGYWPAFWMLGPGSWPSTGEIDIMEDVNASSENSAAFHCGNLTQRNTDGTTGPCHEYTGLTSGLLTCPGCQTGYHVYTVIIDRRDAAEQQIRWYLDGHLFFTVKESQVGSKPWTEAVDHGFSIILDLAVGGRYPDARCRCTAPSIQTTSGATMSVRYVRVYTSRPPEGGAIPMAGGVRRTNHRLARRLKT
jgi:beta-glucanase (GH16 family)